MKWIRRNPLREASALHGAPRALARVLHDATVSAELRVERALDALAGEPPANASLGAITALVKTFERPRTLARLVESIKRLYPTVPVVVVDDSRTPTELPGIETVVMPYDSGVAAGRNTGLRHVRTRYVLVLDDDLVLYRGTRLAAALALMEEHPELDIMGGLLSQLPFYETHPPPRGRIYESDRQPRRPLGSLVGGLEVVDKVPNFMLARREGLERVLWNPRLRLLEHSDFFTRALGVLVTVFNPNLKAFHARTPFDDAYMSKRLDIVESHRILRELYPPR